MYILHIQNEKVQPILHIKQKRGFSTYVTAFAILVQKERNPHKKWKKSYFGVGEVWVRLTSLTCKKLHFSQFYDVLQARQFSDLYKKMKKRWLKLKIQVNKKTLSSIDYARKES